MVITLEIAWLNQFRSKSIYFLPDEQKHNLMVNPEVSSFFSLNGGNGNVRKVGAFLASPDIYRHTETGQLCHGSKNTECHSVVFTMYTGQIMCR